VIHARLEQNFLSWRDRARELLSSNTRPEDIIWSSAHEADSLFSLVTRAEGPPQTLVEKTPESFRVPKEFIDLAQQIACVRDDARWELLYRLLYRLKNESRDLLKITIDPDVNRAHLLLKAIRTDIHKMHAFVRFKRSELDGQEIYLAWHQPEHLIVELAAPFFMRRFGDKAWSIFTPDKSAHWNGEQLYYTDGIPQNQFVVTDDFEKIWKSYYKSIFNPARLNLKAMRAEMPTKHWHTLPEAQLIGELIREAPSRLQAMAKNQNIHAIVPETSDLSQLKKAALGCRACPLHLTGTQTVFGEGAEFAELMIVGEQPGEYEDTGGRPFIGPAGEILDQCLVDAKLDREKIYVTNAVKHFKWKRSGKIRLHQKPSGQEMHSCRPWLEAEIAKVQPRLIVALGLTAGTSLLGRLPKISGERGQILKSHSLNCLILLSWHPSAILRASSEPERQERLAQLKTDLRVAALWLDENNLVH
jgi:probable DNA metabolism protein